MAYRNFIQSFFTIPHLRGDNHGPLYMQQSYIINITKKKSKMSFLSPRFCQFCDFRPKVCFSHLDPKSLKLCHFNPRVNAVHITPLSQGYYRLFRLFFLLN
ncbi:hypothetical protein Hanom_Chr15g01414541 [Helianthus anomalus]